MMAHEQITVTFSRSKLINGMHVQDEESGPKPENESGSIAGVIRRATGHVTLGNAKNSTEQQSDCTGNRLGKATLTMIQTTMNAQPTLPAKSSNARTILQKKFLSSDNLETTHK